MERKLHRTRLVSTVYLRLFIYLPAILSPACASCRLAVCKMYSAYKLNKQGDNTQPCSTLFPILNQSVVPCPVLTVTSWLAYRFLRWQVRWSGIPIFWKNFTQFVMMHTVKGFSINNAVEVDVFLEFSWFFNYPMCSQEFSGFLRFWAWVSCLWISVLFFQWCQDKPLQYFCLENPMERGAWQAMVPVFAKSQMQLKWLSTAQ